MQTNQTTSAGTAASAATDLPRITLTRAPFVSPTVSIFSRVLTPPLGLAYLAGALRERGYPVRVVDPVGEALQQTTPVEGWPLAVYGWPADKTVEEIPADTRYIGVSCMFSHEWPQAKLLIRKARRRFSDAVIIAGGEHVTALPEFSLEDCPELDFGVRGEGEETLIDLVGTLESGGDPAGVAGICFRQDGSVVTTPRRQRIRDIDSIPRPAWDLVPLHDYLSLKLTFGVSPDRTLPILATRGCPFQCTFCSSPQMWTTQWAARDPKAVADEIEYLRDRYGATNFEFYDLTAIIKKDWILEFGQELIDRGLDITWQLPAGTRSEAIDDEVAALLARSGHRNLVYAPESGSERILELIKKRIKIPRMLDSMRCVIRNGISIKMNVICGFPDETWRDLFHTFKFLCKTAWIGVDDACVGTFSPYPGSELFERLREEGRIEELDEAYFYELMTTGDAKAVSYCNAIGPRMLSLYKLAANVGFYCMSFAFRPQRIFQTAWRLLRGNHRTRIEMRLSYILKPVTRRRTVAKEPALARETA